MRACVIALGAGVLWIAAAQPISTQSPSPSALPTASTAAVPPPTRDASTQANVPMPTLTPEEARTLVAIRSSARLDAVRARLSAQVAVYDAIEGALRRPTPDEAAALAPAAPQTAAEVVNLSNGVALRGAGRLAEALTATVDGDRVTVDHTIAVKGGRRVQ